MLTFKSVVDALGADAQVTGGTVIVYRDGKHIEVGRVSADTGSFTVTPAGHALLEAISGAEPEAVEAAPAKSKAKTKAKPTAEKADDPFSDIGADD